MAQTAQAKVEKPEPAPVELKVDKPVAQLVVDGPAPKRRGRPPGGGAPKPAAAAKPARKAKKGQPSVLYLVETEEGSGLFEIQSLTGADDLLDLIDESRRVIATREWRDF